MKKVAPRFVFLLISVLLVVTLAGCSGDTQAASSGGQAAAQSGEIGAPRGAGAENTVMGVLSSIDGSTLEIELIEFGGGGAGPQDGSMPDRSEMPDGWPPGDEGQPPKMPQDASFQPPDSMPPREDMPEGGFPGGEAGMPPTTGESMTIATDNDTAFSSMDGTEHLALADLPLGAMLRIELAEDGATAVQISVMHKADEITEGRGIS